MRDREEESNTCAKERGVGGRGVGVTRGARGRQVTAPAEAVDDVAAALGSWVPCRTHPHPHTHALGAMPLPLVRGCHAAPLRRAPPPRAARAACATFLSFLVFSPSLSASHFCLSLSLSSPRLSSTLLAPLPSLFSPLSSPFSPLSPLPSLSLPTSPRTRKRTRTCYRSGGGDGRGRGGWFGRGGDGGRERHGGGLNASSFGGSDGGAGGR